MTSSQSLEGTSRGDRGDETTLIPRHLVLTSRLDALGRTRRDHVPLLRRIYASAISAMKDPSLNCSSISSLTLVTHYSLNTLFSPRIPFPLPLLPHHTQAQLNYHAFLLAPACSAPRRLRARRSGQARRCLGRRRCPVGLRLSLCLCQPRQRTFRDPEAPVDRGESPRITGRSALCSRPSPPSPASTFRPSSRTSSPFSPPLRALSPRLSPTSA